MSIGSNFGGSLIGWKFISPRNFSVDEQATVKAMCNAHICNWNHSAQSYINTHIYLSNIRLSYIAMLLSTYVVGCSGSREGSRGRVRYLCSGM